MDINLFLDILNIESTSGSERALADRLEKHLATEGCSVQRIPADADSDRPVSLLFSWGNPELVFCTHLDTVPPYIRPTIEISPDGDTIVRGRGACDAKGQIFAMYNACLRLADDGLTDFGLLLLHGEETGSFGAKEYASYPGAEYLIVGEPTDNRLVSASKGTKAFEITIHGRKCHSGYPDCGISAIDRFVDLVNRLRTAYFPVDPILGQTTWNIGKLHSDNPQNILSDMLRCRIYFRTTFASDALVCGLMDNTGVEGVEVNALGGDTPLHYFTLPGFPTATVAFGSDAPHLTNFKHKMICGPGSILSAHTPEEYISMKDISAAIDNYVKIAKSVLKKQHTKTAQTKDR